MASDKVVFTVIPELHSRVLIGQCLLMFVCGFLGAVCGTALVLALR